jgi:hypothetical protein
MLQLRQRQRRWQRGLEMAGPLQQESRLGLGARRMTPALSTGGGRAAEEGRRCNQLKLSALSAELEAP